MSALRGGIPRALRNHRSRDGAAYGAYARAKVARFGPLPGDARPWLREAGLLTLALAGLHQEGEAARAALANGAGRRRRETLRAQIARFERRATRLRASLEAAERRLEELAARNDHGDDLALRMAALHQQEKRHT